MTKKPIIIFGTGKIAEVIYHYATAHCGYEIAAFTVDDAYLLPGKYLDKPVLAISEIAKQYPPDRFDAFVAIGYHDLNRLRQRKCEEMLAIGYRLVSIVSSSCNLPPSVNFGANCFIMPPSVIHPHVTIGDNTFIWSGAVVGHHTTLSAHNWVTSGANISGNTRIGQNNFFAINATLGHGITIGNCCFFGANALVTGNCEDESVFVVQSTPKLRLNSAQFLRISKLSHL